MEHKRFFSESSLARHLGTTRYRLQSSGIAPAFRSGIQKLYGLTASELTKLEADFADESNLVIKQFSAASREEQARLASDPQAFAILRNHRTKLAKLERATILKKTSTN